MRKIEVLASSAKSHKPSFIALQKLINDKSILNLIMESKETTKQVFKHPDISKIGLNKLLTKESLKVIKQLKSQKAI